MQKNGDYPAYTTRECIKDQTGVATAIQTSMLRMILLNAELESAADPAGIDESEAAGVIYVRSTDTMDGP